MYVNSLYIARFFRASHYTPNNRTKLPFGLDLNVHFRLRDNQQTIYLKGYPPQRMDIMQTIVFKACPADCAHPNGLIAEWWIGGVSLGKLSEEEPPAESCERHTDGHSIDRFTTCDCKLNEKCEVDAVTGECSDREDVEFGGCKQCNFGPKECRWNDTYYLDGGVLCHQVFHAGDCSFTQQDVIIAINFNSNDSTVFNQTDSFGIRYQVHNNHTCGPDDYPNPNHKGGPYDNSRERIRIMTLTSVGDEERLNQVDPNDINIFGRNLSRAYWYSGNWNNTYPQNLTYLVESDNEFEKHHLFGVHIYGAGDHNEDWVKYKCLKCRLDLKNNPDGAYQLGILTGDFHFNKPGMRLFSYKINDLQVVKEIDLVATGADRKNSKITYRQYKPMRLIIHFRVTHNGTKLHVKGFPPKEMNGTIDFGPCYGDCLGYSNKEENLPWNHWHLAAYYVIKFKNVLQGGGGSLIDE